MGRLRKFYVEAQQDPDARQPFLTRLSFPHFSEYVSTISYSSSAPHEKDTHYSYKLIQKPATQDTTVMEVIPTRLAEYDFIARTKSRIIVYPSSFEAYTLEEFLTALVIHEGMHAREYFENPAIIEGISRKAIELLRDPFVKTLTEIKKDIADAESELRAYRAELQSPWPVRQSYTDELHDMIVEEEECKKKLVALYNNLILASK